MSDTDPITLPPLSSVEAPLVDLTDSAAPSGTSLEHLLDDPHPDYAEARGVTEAAALAAGWRSVGDAAGLRAVLDAQGYPGGRLRYGQAVTRRIKDSAGALVCPRWHPDGSPGVPQIRLDDPREGAGGRAVKWETPSTAASTAAELTATASAPVWWAPQSWMSNPAVPVIVSEGETRVLATATAAAREGVAVVPVSVTGVWNAIVTSKSSSGTVISRTLLPDLAALALPGRTVIVSYDHDAVLKRGVRDALEALATLLEAEGARVLVMVPPMVDDDAATGLDDAIAAGHSLVEMVAGAVPMADLPPLEEKADRGEDDTPAAPYDSIRVPDRPAEPIGDVLADVEAHLRRYLGLVQDSDYRVLALWMAAAHLAPSLDYMPYLLVTAATPGAGKTTVLEHLGRLSPSGDEAPSTSQPTRAYLVRVRAGRPLAMLLLDEVQRTLVQTRSGADLQPIHAVLNAAYRRGGMAEILEEVQQTDGTRSWEVVRHAVYGPIAMAGIAARLPEDVRSRCLQIAMVRRSGLEPSIPHEVEPIAAELRSRLLASTAAIRETVRTAPWPSTIDRASWGRPSELLYPLAVLADLAGGDWPETIRALQQAQADAAADGVDDSPAARLIRDAHRVWREGADAMTSTELSRALASRYPGSWGSAGRYHSDLTPRTLGRMLRDAGVRSHHAETGTAWHRAQMRPHWVALGLETDGNADGTASVSASVSLPSGRKPRSDRKTDGLTESGASLEDRKEERERPAPAPSSFYLQRGAPASVSPSVSRDDLRERPDGSLTEADSSVRPSVRTPDPDEEIDLDALIGTVDPIALRASQVD
jgi:hypothetical protein